MNQVKGNMKRGAVILFLIFSLLFFILIFRFMVIQITGEVDGKVLAAKAAQQHLRSAVLEATRGNIYDQHGEVIAEDTVSYTLIAILDPKVTTDMEHPRHVVDPEMTAEKLATVLPMSKEKIYQNLTKKGRFQVEFGSAGRNLTVHEKEQIESLNLPGITFIEDRKRSYPNGVFASHLIGFAEKEVVNGKEELVGVLGIEKSFNDLLKGKDGYIQYESDIWEYILPNSTKMVKKPENGKDIYLTIDKKIQTFLEDALTEVEKEYSPKKMIAIVADPKTGRILAMGQRPSFHLETREGINQSWHNEVVEWAYEPGSTMKIFSLAAAVEEGVFHPEEKYVSGSYRLESGGSIRDHNGKGWGKITFLEGVQRSSNVAFAYLLEKMGTDVFREYLDAFKFGVPTGIGLPNEPSGQILYNWPIEKVTTAFGQGTTVTPLQLIQAMTAIANDGKMMKPYVIEKIVDPDTNKVIKQSEPAVVGTPISKQTAKEVRDILETVVSAPEGTGHAYQLEGYDVAGKTGTAQIPNPDGRGYLTGWDNYLFSFLGMAPKDDPQLIMYVAIQQPDLDDEKYEPGSAPVSKIFNPVMKNSLQYLNIQPKEMKEAKIVEVPNVIGMSVEKAKKTLEKEGVQVIVLGKGSKVERQLPEEHISILEHEKVIIQTDGKLTIPDMTGWSKRDVMKVAEIAELELNMVGKGFVINQNLKPNSPVKQGDQLVVTFQTPEEKMNSEMEETGEEEELPLN
jgi:penicillin-binding protein 2B